MRPSAAAAVALRPARASRIADAVLSVSKTLCDGDLAAEDLGENIAAVGYDVVAQWWRSRKQALRWARRRRRRRVLRGRVVLAVLARRDHADRWQCRACWRIHGLGQHRYARHGILERADVHANGQEHFCRDLAGDPRTDLAKAEAIATAGLRRRSLLAQPEALRAAFRDRAVRPPARALHPRVGTALLHPTPAERTRLAAVLERFPDSLMAVPVECDKVQSAARRGRTGGGTPEFVFRAAASSTRSPTTRACAVHEGPPATRTRRRSPLPASHAPPIASPRPWGSLAAFNAAGFLAWRSWRTLPLPRL